MVLGNARRTINAGGRCRVQCSDPAREVKDAPSKRSVAFEVSWLLEQRQSAHLASPQAAVCIDLARHQDGGQTRADKLAGQAETIDGGHVNIDQSQLSPLPAFGQGKLNQREVRDRDIYQRNRAGMGGESSLKKWEFGRIIVHDQKAQCARGGSRDNRHERHHVGG